MSNKVIYPAKQVIVMRKDLRNEKGDKVRTGKLLAQACHASLAAYKKSDKDIPAFIAWNEGSFAKIVLAVDSVEELLTLAEAARLAWLNVAIITDVGNTEFGGVPTTTCIAIGPHWSNEIDAITGHLKLF